MKDLRTISQVGKEFGVDEYTLRYWDRLGILVPRRVGAMRVYGEEEEKKLRVILRLLEEGHRPSEIRNYLQAASWVDERSVSQTKALHSLLARAKKGDVVREEFTLNTYNTVYQRLQRSAKKHGKKVLIKTSQDGKALEAKVIDEIPKRGVARVRSGDGRPARAS